MAAKLQPLSQNFAIVTAAGLPTEYFIRWAQERQVDIGAAISEEQAEALISEAITDFAKSRKINTGTGLTGGGTLEADRTISLADTAVEPGTYGSSTKSAKITIDQQGRITAADEEDIAGGSANVQPTSTGPSGRISGRLPHSWWRINVTGVQSGTYVTFAELQFREVSGTPETPSGGAADQSSFYGPDYVGAKAFDGNPTTIYHSDTNTPAYAWVSYHFPVAIFVQQVGIQTRNSDNGVTAAPDDFDIQWSDDGVVWTTEWSVANASFSSFGQWLYFNNTSPEPPPTDYYPTKVVALNDIAKTPPTDGQVLAWNAADQRYEPVTPSGGGGGGSYVYAPLIAPGAVNNDSANATKGLIIIPAIAITIGAMSLTSFADTAGVVTFQLLQLNGSNIVTAVLDTVTGVPWPVGSSLEVVVPLHAKKNLAAGTRYALVLVATDRAPDAVVNAGSLGSPTWLAPFGVQNANRFSQTKNTAFVVGDAITGDTGGAFDFRLFFSFALP